MSLQNQLPTPVFGVSGTSMATSFNGMPFLIPQMSGVSYAFSWVGSSPMGTLSVQVSNDYSLDGQGNVANPGTWNTLPILVSGSYVTSIPVSGNTGNGFIDVGQTHAYAIRPVYTASSGSGTILGTFVGKYF